MESRAVDNTDWLKAAAIILVVVDHTGYFFIKDADWWHVFGRMAAPIFFFLLGYATSRTVPVRWIGVGVILTLLESWNAGWAWVAPNILLSLALIRLVRPYAQAFLQRHGWVAFAVFISALIAVLPIASNIFDFGAEGWLWALFGLCQRIYVDGNDGNSTAEVDSHAMTQNMGLMRLLACVVAAVVYVWQEQMEFSFSQIQFTVFIFGVGVLILSLCAFRRGPSRVQPQEPIAGSLRFFGRYTLEIYAIQLAGSELIIRLLPALAP